MGKFDRYISVGKDIKIKNEVGEEDTFHISPLPFEFLGDFFSLMKNFGKVDFKKIEKLESEEEKANQMLEIFDKEVVDKISLLIYESLRISYPEEDKEKLKSFAATNFMKLLPTIIEVNTKNLN